MNQWMRNFIVENGQYMRRKSIEEYLAWRRFSFGGFFSKLARKEALRVCAQVREASK